MALEYEKAFRKLEGRHTFVITMELHISRAIATAQCDGVMTLCDLSYFIVSNWTRIVSIERQDNDPWTAFQLMAWEIPRMQFKCEPFLLGHLSVFSDNQSIFLGNWPFNSLSFAFIIRTAFVFYPFQYFDQSIKRVIVIGISNVYWLVGKYVRYKQKSIHTFKHFQLGKSNE